MSKIANEQIRVKSYFVSYFTIQSGHGMVRKNLLQRRSILKIWLSSLLLTLLGCFQQTTSTGCTSISQYVMWISFKKHLEISLLSCIVFIFDCDFILFEGKIQFGHMGYHLYHSSILGQIMLTPGYLQYSNWDLGQTYESNQLNF